MKHFKIEYVLAERTSGANPFKIFESLPKLDQCVLSFTLKRMNYEVFMRTAYWFSVSSVAKSRAGSRCQVCNSSNGLTTHHRTYDTHGSEHNHMEDLVVLCQNCHGLFHGHLPPDYVPSRHKKNEGRIKLPKNHVIPHGDVSHLVPTDESIVLTKELINNCRANGSFTNATLNALGMTRQNMMHGWVDRLIGTSISRENYKSALEGKFTYRAKLNREPIQLL